MSSICGSIANKCEAKCHSNCASSHTTSDSSQACCRVSGCKCVCVPTLRGMRVSRVIQGLAQKQANKIYAEVVSVVRNKRDENYTILIPLVTKTHTGKTQTKYNRYTGGYDYEESTIPTGCKWKRVSICCKKLNDEEASIAFVARKYFEVKADKPEAPFDIILKDLRLWAKALPNTYL